MLLHKYAGNEAQNASPPPKSNHKNAYQGIWIHTNALTELN